MVGVHITEGIGSCFPPSKKIHGFIGVADADKPQIVNAKHQKGLFLWFSSMGWAKGMWSQQNVRVIQTGEQMGQRVKKFYIRIQENDPPEFSFCK